MTDRRTNRQMNQQGHSYVPLQRVTKICIYSTVIMKSISTENALWCIHQDPTDNKVNICSGAVTSGTEPVPDPIHVHVLTQDLCQWHNSLYMLFTNMHFLPWLLLFQEMYQNIHYFLCKSLKWQLHPWWSPNTSSHCKICYLAEE